MSDQATKARQFTELHAKGDPIIIYNAWDGGSARAIASAGAKAIATGDHPVGFSHGYTNDDFDGFTFESYLSTIKDIARAIDLPFSVDISNAFDLDDEGLRTRIKQLLEIGVIGINFEDRSEDTEQGLVSAEEHAARIKTIRAVADEAGIPLFINARTDLFAIMENHEELLDEALARAEAYAAAGANGFFVPGLMNIELIKQLCERSPLPVNIIRLPGAPGTSELIDAGVSRISYGPVVQMAMTEWLQNKAKEVFTSDR